MTLRNFNAIQRSIDAEREPFFALVRPVNKAEVERLAAVSRRIVGRLPKGRQDQLRADWLTGESSADPMIESRAHLASLPPELRAQLEAEWPRDEEYV